MSAGVAGSACPACIVTPAAQAVSGLPMVGENTILISLPGIHCGGCISAVERILHGCSGVRTARVNLTLKRAMVDADPETDPEQLVRALAAGGYQAFELDAGSIGQPRSNEKAQMLLTRLAVAGFAMMNVMLLSVAVWSGATDATRDLFHWISAAIALPTVAYSAKPFFDNAWSALRVRRVNMDVPISLAIILALCLSVYETSQGGRHAYFDAALSLTFFLLVGRYLDQQTRSAARSAAEELTALEVPRATLADGTVVAVADVSIGDMLRVVPGARIPVDGLVATGTSERDRSLLTGESLPVFTEPGTPVNAGEVNLTGPLIIRATTAGTDTSLRRMADFVAIAETARNKYTSLADKAARIYVPLVHLLALSAFAGWMLYAMDVRFAVNVAVAVLIITCPCALGLAVPAVTTAASGRLFRRGLLLKSATALERLAEVDTVVFDKTGTLTQGQPEPQNIADYPHDVLGIALGLAQQSGHPLSRALSTAISDAGMSPANLTDVRELPGYGVSATHDGMDVALGRADWLDATPCKTTATYLKIGQSQPIAFQFNDVLREGAEQCISDLKSQGQRVVLLSGDSINAVDHVADELGINERYAQMLPTDKATWIEDVTANGSKVLMVGDGLNDTAALAGAHVSISPASALDAARAVSDIVLVHGSLAAVGQAVLLSQSSTRRIKENFAIAALYNLIAVPIALAGLASPLVAALAMSASSITVSLNALRLAEK